MTLGAEPKKVLVLGVLLAVAAVSAYINLAPTSPPTSGRRPAPASSTIAPSATAAVNTQQETAASTAPRGGVVRRAATPGGGGRAGEFRPVFKPERSDSRLDPTQVDPALNLELLAKLRDVRLRGTGRNLFQFGEAPAPPRPPEPKIIPKPLGPDGRPIDEAKPAEPAEPVKPPPPPIPLRYYGFADPRQSAEKRAFFMEGEDIRIAAEGELIRDRFRVVEISPRTAVVEDTQHDNRQTLTIQAESGG